MLVCCLKNDFRESSPLKIVSIWIWKWRVNLAVVQINTVNITLRLVQFSESLVFFLDRQMGGKSSEIPVKSKTRPKPCVLHSWQEVCNAVPPVIVPGADHSRQVTKFPSTTFMSTRLPWQVQNFFVVLAGLPLVLFV